MLKNLLLTPKAQFVTAFGACVVLTAVAAAVSNSSSPDYAVTLRLSHDRTAGSIADLAAYKFKELIEQNSASQVTVDIYPNNGLSGGDQTRAIEMLKDGSIDLQICSATDLYGLDQRFATFWLPFLFDNEEQARYFANDPEVRSILSSWLSPYGLELLTMHTTGARQLSNNVRDIKTPEDMQGITFRVNPYDMPAEIITAFGGNTKSLDFSEVPHYLEQGEIQGLTSNLVLFLSSKLYENQKYLTLWDGIYDIQMWIANDNSLNKLDQRQKSAFTESLVETIKWQNNLYNEFKKLYMKTLEQKGVKITVLNEEQRNAFRTKAESIYRNYIELLGQDTLMFFLSHRGLDVDNMTSVVPIEANIQQKAQTAAEETVKAYEEAQAATETTPDTAAPVEAETAPAESTPAEAAPVETAPVEDAPAETAPAETAPVEAAPVETVPVEAAPAEEVPAETAPAAETAPVEAAPEAPAAEAAPAEDVQVEEPAAPETTEDLAITTLPADPADAIVTPVKDIEKAQAEAETPAPAEATPVEAAPIEATATEEAVLAEVTVSTEEATDDAAVEAFDTAAQAQPKQKQVEAVPAAELTPATPAAPAPEAPAPSPVAPAPTTVPVAPAPSPVAPAPVPAPAAPAPAPVAPAPTPAPAAPAPAPVAPAPAPVAPAAAPAPRGIVEDVPAVNGFKPLIEDYASVRGFAPVIEDYASVPGFEPIVISADAPKAVKLHPVPPAVKPVKPFHKAPKAVPVPEGAVPAVVPVQAVPAMPSVQYIQVPVNQGTLQYVEVAPGKFQMVQVVPVQQIPVQQVQPVQYIPVGTQYIQVAPAPVPAPAMDAPVPAPKKPVAIRPLPAKIDPADAPAPVAPAAPAPVAPAAPAPVTPAAN